MKPGMTFRELANLEEQAEIASLLQVDITGVPVILVENGIPGEWYEVVQPNQQELIIHLKRPFYFECDPQEGISRLVIKLAEHILGLNETLALRHENQGPEGCAEIHLATSRKLLELGYDSIAFYENEPLHLREVCIIPDCRL